LQDSDDSGRFRDLLNRIVERADGVFLWAVIAIRDLREGIQGMADMQELANAMEFLPAQLEGVFMLMLHRMKPVYQRDAARLLQTVLFDDESRTKLPDFSLDLCRLHLSLSQTEFEDAPFVYKPVATSDLTKACHILRTRILSHTVGFLDLTPSRSIPWVYGKGKDGNPILFAKVSFLHRTTRDFFLSNDEAKSFLAHKGFNEAQVTLSIAMG